MIISKRVLQICIVLLLVTESLFSQNLYVNISAGYNLPMGSKFIIENAHGVENEELRLEPIYTSYGEGLNLNSILGYSFSDYLKTELGVSFLLGTKKKAIQELDTEDADIFEEIVFFSRMIQLNPALVISTNLKGINPYIKMGPVLGMGKIHRHIIIDYNEDHVTSKYTESGGIAIGTKASIGALFFTRNNYVLFGDINFINMSYAPKRGVFTEVTLNGNNELDNSTIYELEVEYLDNYEYESFDEDLPRKALKVNRPFSSVGVNFGININF